MLTTLLTLLTVIRARLQSLHADQRGYSTETVVVTALLIALALAVIAVIAAAVTGKAHQISTTL
jgi:hypothetical protein